MCSQSINQTIILFKSERVFLFAKAKYYKVYTPYRLNTTNN